MNDRNKTPSVALIMGSQSDWDTMKFSEKTLVDLGIPVVTKIVSAHRTPERLFSYAKTAEKKGIKVIIFEPNLDSKYFFNSEVINDLKKFKKLSEIIIANRKDNNLIDVKDKLFTRDIFGKD